MNLFNVMINDLKKYGIIFNRKSLEIDKSLTF
jgi:hypothetical protein